jgi:hypothetical protein
VTTRRPRRWRDRPSQPQQRRELDGVVSGASATILGSPVRVVTSRTARSVALRRHRALALRSAAAGKIDLPRALRSPRPRSGSGPTMQCPPGNGASPEDAHPTKASGRRHAGTGAEGQLDVTASTRPPCRACPPKPATAPPEPTSNTSPPPPCAPGPLGRAPCPSAFGLPRPLPRNSIRRPQRHVDTRGQFGESDAHRHQPRPGASSTLPAPETRAKAGLSCAGK